MTAEVGDKIFIFGQNTGTDNDEPVIQYNDDEQRQQQTSTPTNPPTDDRDILTYYDYKALSGKRAVEWDAGSLLVIEEDTVVYIGTRSDTDENTGGVLEMRASTASVEIVFFSDIGYGDRSVDINTFHNTPTFEVHAAFSNTANDEPLVDTDTSDPDPANHTTQNYKNFTFNYPVLHLGKLTISRDLVAPDEYSVVQEYSGITSRGLYTGTNAVTYTLGINADEAYRAEHGTDAFLWENGQSISVGLTSDNQTAAQIFVAPTVVNGHVHFTSDVRAEQGNPITLWLPTEQDGHNSTYDAGDSDTGAEHSYAKVTIRGINESNYGQLWFDRDDFTGVYRFSILSAEGYRSWEKTLSRTVPNNEYEIDFEPNRIITNSTAGHQHFREWGDDFDVTIDMAGVDTTNLLYFYGVTKMRAKYIFRDDSSQRLRMYFLNGNYANDDDQQLIYFDCYAELREAGEAWWEFEITQDGDVLRLWATNMENGYRREVPTNSTFLIDEAISDPNVDSRTGRILINRDDRHYMVNALQTNTSNFYYVMRGVRHFYMTDYNVNRDRDLYLRLQRHDGTYKQLQIISHGKEIPLEFIRSGDTTDDDWIVREPNGTLHTIDMGNTTSASFSTTSVPVDLFEMKQGSNNSALGSFTEANSGAYSVEMKAPFEKGIVVHNAITSQGSPESTTELSGLILTDEDTSSSPTNSTAANQIGVALHLTDSSGDFGFSKFRRFAYRIDDEVRTVEQVAPVLSIKETYDSENSDGDDHSVDSDCRLEFYGEEIRWYNKGDDYQLGESNSPSNDYAYFRFNNSTSDSSKNILIGTNTIHSSSDYLGAIRFAPNNDVCLEIVDTTGTGTFYGLSHSASSNAFLVPTTNASSSNRTYLGGSTRRFRKYFGNASSDISSDTRIKKNIEDIPEELYEVWHDYVVPKSYNLTDELDEESRHVGVLAQDVIRAFEAAGVDWRYYGVVTESLEKHKGFEDDELGQLSVSYEAINLIGNAAMLYKLKKAGIL
ncbi:hypothetical protein [Vibrio phage RYC]|nr:hypothetical protein [Vibrio phage RYC]